jgi:hypothetical protein
MACLGSVLCEETQLGESGQAASLPPVIPTWAWRFPEHPTIITTRQMNQYLNISPPSFPRLPLEDDLQISRGAGGETGLAGGQIIDPFPSESASQPYRFESRGLRQEAVPPLPKGAGIVGSDLLRLADRKK